MNELQQAALEIIMKMRPHPDGWTIYPKCTKGEPVKRYIHRITRTRDAERDYNRRARERTA